MADYKLIEVKDHGTRFINLHHEIMSIKHLVYCSMDAPYITCCFCDLDGGISGRDVASS